MLFTATYYLLKKININNYLLSLCISTPIYIILLNLSKTIHFYSSIVIGFDLFFLNNSIQDNKQKISSKEHQKKLTNDFTNLANKYFDYLKKNDLKNKKIVKNYVKTKLNIKDTLQHTINNISN